MSKSKLGEWLFDGGYASSVPRIFLRNILAFGSLNAILTGLGFVRNFGGLDKIVTAGKGSTQFFQTDNTFAGLGDEETYGIGSVFKVKNLLALTGEGPVRVSGADIDVDADSTLQYVKKEAGLYVDPAYPAGQARPSSQTIYPKLVPGAGHTGMDGSVATVIWRIDSATGQPSLASLSSNVLLLTGQSVIQPFPITDTAQDYWGIGVSKPGFGSAPVFYQLKTDLGGEVAESTLAYNRTVNASIVIATSPTQVTLDGATPVDDRFTAADVGRRIVDAASAIDSWIVSITDEFNAEMNDVAGGDVTNEDFVITHAIDGILRAVEISWTTESLAGQDLAPFDAYPPPSNLAWAGMLNDAMFVETSDGIIYVGVVGFIGSYPPKNTLFPAEPAILYLDASDGLYWRFSKNGLTALVYIGGPRPLELQTVWKNVGILFPQNAAIGKGGRVIAWSGKPVRLGAGVDPDIEFAFKVYKDFEGWNAQTAARPVICQYDPENQFECWAYYRRIMCVRGGTDQWCAPIDVSPYMADAQPAHGSFSVQDKTGLDGTTININGVVFTFSTSSGAGNNILYNGAGTLASINLAVATKLNASVNPLISVATWSALGINVNGVYDTPGAAGNLFTMATGTAGARVDFPTATFEEGADPEYLIAAVIVDNKLRFATNAGTELSLYHFDEGDGSTMTIQTPEIESAGETDTITQFDAVVHIDETETIAVSIIKNFDDANPIPVKTFEPDSTPTDQNLTTRANIICAKQHAVKLEIESDGKNVGVQKVTTFGETNNIFLP